MSARSDPVDDADAVDNEFARLLARARFPRWVIVYLVGLGVVVVLSVTAVFVVLVAQRDDDRQRFCDSLDGFGAIALAGGEGVLKTFLDPSLQQPGDPPPPPEIVAAFVNLYRTNTAASIADAVAVVKEANRCP